LKADSINQVIRKVRAQTLLDGMARELTPLISKALSILNPEKDDYYPDDSIKSFGSLAIGTNLNNFEITKNEKWGYSRQLDYFIGVCQAGLYCLEPKKIEQLALEAKDKTNPISTFSRLLSEHAPFVLSDENRRVIERLIPDSLAHYQDEPTTNSDQKRFFKLARIIFLIEAFHFRNTQDGISIQIRFNKTFLELINRFLAESNLPLDYTPKSKNEEEEFFTSLNRYMDSKVIEPDYLPTVRSFLPNASRLIDFRILSSNVCSLHSIDHLEKDDRHLTILEQLDQEITHGASSLVGGRDYTRFRFAESILKRAAFGLIPIVIVDGTKHEAEALVIQKYLSNASEILAIDTCGQYGDFSKTLYKFTDSSGEKRLIFCIAQAGEYRVLSNSTALLLYGPKKDINGQTIKKNTRIPISAIHSYYRTTPINSIIGSEIKKALEAATLSRPASITSIKKVIALPATSAETILSGLQNRGLILDKTMTTFPTLGKTFAAWIENPQDKQVYQLLIPSVGGAGLYGDTAGIFVEEFLKLANKKSPIPLCKTIKFLATAGAIKTPGFEIGEGDLVTPTGKFVAYNLGSQIRVPLKPPINKAIIQYADHGWAPCPAIETDIGFKSLLADTNVHLGMIDVEGLPIASAIQEHNLHAIHEPATFSPIYIVSDVIDPNRAIPKNGHDYHSYAFGCRAGMALHLTTVQLHALADWITD
jgi:hypothetical protein